MSETTTRVYPVGLFSDHRRKRIRYGVRHYLWSYGIKGRRWRAVRNYFNGYLAEHEGCSHNAGRGWTRKAALRRVERIHALATPDPSPAALDGLVEEGRRLASKREDLIAAGVDPATLAIPLNLATPDAPRAALDEARRDRALGLVGLGDPCWGPCDPDCEIGSSHCYGDHLPRAKADWLEHVPPCPAALDGTGES